MKKGYEKRFNKGDIVFWCHHEGNANYSVKFGMVDEQFSDAVCIDYLAQRELRRVDGVPIDEFEDEQRYRKLPKGWTYDTKLFDITRDELPKEEREYILDFNNPDTIKIAYDKGYLVKDSEIFYGIIETEITKEGFRVVKKYPMWNHHISHVSIRPDKVYFTYKEAKEEVDSNIAEFERQAALSDYDWSVEQIDKTLNRWANICDIKDDEKQKYRNWLLEMDNVEDIEVRMSNFNIQWKYWKNKRWNNIEL